MTEFNKAPQNDNPFKWIIGAVLGIGAIAWFANSGGTKSGASFNTVGDPQSATTGSNLEASEADPTPSPPLPFDPSAAQRGYRQFQMIAAAHVPGSSEIFSKNCYEALGKPFDWHQLDRCGAYDSLAVRWTEENENVAGNDDLTYFQSEAAATRYLQAATSGGLSADLADTRWAALQKLALKARLAKKAPEPQVAAVATDQNADGTAPAEGGDSDFGSSGSNSEEPTD